MPSTEASAGRSGEVLVRCERLVVGHRQPLAPPLDFDVRRGDFVAVLGRNGSGKSTWVKTVLGLLAPLSGRCRRAEGLRVAYVPQTEALAPHLPVRVRDVVAWGRLFGFELARPAFARIDRYVCQWALEQMGVAELADRSFHELSAGQRQKVALARVLASDADVAFLDEPTAAMDVVSERHAVARIAALAVERKMAVIVVTHAVDLAVRHASGALFFQGEGAEVLRGGPAQVLGERRVRSQLGIAEVH